MKKIQVIGAVALMVLASGIFIFATSTDVKKKQLQEKTSYYLRE